MLPSQSLTPRLINQPVLPCRLKVGTNNVPPYIDLDAALTDIDSRVDMALTVNSITADVMQYIL